MKRKLLVAACVILISLMTTGVIVAGASEHPTKNTTGTNISENKEVDDSLKNMDSALVQLMNASDKEQFAEQNGIDYRDGRVQVVVEMEENAKFPEFYDTTNELNYTGQGENLVQAYVPADSLRPLSNESGVERVRLPMGSVSLQKNGKNETGEVEGPEMGGDEEHESNETRENQGADENEDQGEGLSSVMGGVLATLIIVLTAAYARRKL